jgi:hypothetical protein
MPSRTRVAEKFESIRSWDGSKARAFEEFCYQLRDSSPAGAELIKTGDPDAGVEWYWRYGDGKEIGWQAKFIFDTDGLLKAMRESLKSAVEKREGLRKMTFCIPWDLADDPSRARGKQARERFDEAKDRWREFAPKVEVELLSGGQLLDRLALEEHRGREWFFFGDRILGKEWCSEELKGTIEDAGDRYTPQQNVDLPIDRILEAVAQPKDFEEDLRSRLDAVLRAGREMFKRSESFPHWAEQLAAIKGAVVKLEGEPLLGQEPPTISTERILEHVDEALQNLENLAQALRPIAWPPQSERSGALAKSAADKTLAAERERSAASAQSLWGKSQSVEDALGRLKSFLVGPACQAAERAALFVEGAAGRGKTHLFCDVGQRLLAHGHPVVVLLGQRFRDPSPWKTLASLLGDPNLSPDEIATVLSASGEACGRRAVLFIDAINEATDASMWASELSDMRRRLTASKWIGFAVSCRTTYLDLVEPPGGPDQAFARVEHLGYRGREFEATERIFELHGLVQPHVPLLLPEFSDPLFLKLYCEGFKDDPHPPSGSDHLSAVFERFVAARSERVRKALHLDRHLGIVGKAMDAFAERLAESGVEWLEYEQAESLINGFAPHLQSSPNTLLERMASEGLLAIDRAWVDENEELEEVVAFPYQRFSDHLVLGAFLEKRLPDAEQSEVLDAFAPGEQLGKWLQQAPGGLVEALAIQLPEKWGIELPDLWPPPAEADPRARFATRDAMRDFIASLVVRNRTAFGPRTTELVNDGFDQLPEDMADALISVAPDPAHPYNGARLHDFLAGHAMAARDAFWGQLLYQAFGDPGHSLDRLIRWAARGPYDTYPEDVVELACLPLVWTLALPNRFARDYATKALATLLIGRMDLCRRLIDRFAAIDDPYVKQRLVAAVVGSITRRRPKKSDRPEVSRLLDALISSYIESDSALPDILTRDYIASLARSLRREKLITPRLLQRALPPYTSKPPRVPRRKKYLEETYPNTEERHEGYGSLLFSALSTHSDWTRYEVSGQVDDFLPVKLGEPIPPKEEPNEESEWRTNQVAWKRFLKSLSSEHLELFTSEEKDQDFGELLKLLDADQLMLLSKVYVRRGGRKRPKPRPMAFPVERAGRFIFQRCIEFGWTPALFGEFDRSVAWRDRGRESHKAERFGKKYQWIALYELLARLSDNFTMIGWRDVRSYEGAWQLRVRDIDPTVPPERIKVGTDQEQARQPTFPLDSRPAWWSRGTPTFGELEPGKEGDWAELREDLPTPDDLLRLVDTSGAPWVIVSGFHNWQRDSDELASVTAEEAPDRDLTIRSLGTLVRRSHLDRLQHWLDSHPDLVRAIPDWMSHPIYQAFWSEIPDESGAHDYPPGWRAAESEGRLPVRSVAVGLGYSAESSGIDCSLSQAISIESPSKYLSDLVGAQWDETRNLWIDSNGHPFAQYRRTDDGFHNDHALMVSEAALAAVLRENGLALAVGMFCERRIFSRTTYTDPKALGWTDYAGHLIFDGEEWSSASLQPIDRHAE